MHAVNSPQFRAAVSSLKSGTTRERISRKNLARIEFPVPPLPEQRRIVAKIEELFSNLDAGMDDLQAAGQQLERYRLSVLQAAVEGRLTADWRRAHDPEPADQLLERILEERQDQWEERYRWERYDSKGKKPPSGWKSRYSPPEEPEENTADTLPDGWCWVTIDQITQTVTKGSSPGHQGFEYKEEGIPFLRSQNVRWGQLDLEGIEHLDESFNEAQTKSVIEEDDVFLNIVGASIGRAAKADERLDGANMNQAVALIRPVLRSALPEYMVIYLLSPTMQNYIEQKKVEVARANLNLGEIKSFEIPPSPSPRSKRISG
jgi:type I restriction enzyme S subunit